MTWAWLETVGEALDFDQQLASPKSNLTAWWAISFSETNRTDLLEAPPFSYQLYALYGLANALPLILPPFPFKSSLFIAINFALFVQMSGGTTGNPFMDMLIHCTLIYQLLRIVDLLVLRGPPERNYELVNPDFDRNKKEAQPYQGSWFDMRRIMRIAAYMCSVRGTGWSWQVRGLAKVRPYKSRWDFAWPLFVKGILIIIAFDIFQIMMVSNTLPVDGSLPWPMRCIMAQFTGITAILLLSMIYNFAAAVVIGLGFSDPEFWPPLFGDWSELYSVRQFWGNFWHQMLRRTLTSYGQFVAKSLRIPPRSTLNLIVQLFVAFFLSGCLHAFGSWAMARNDCGSMFYFTIQAVAITFEMAMVGLAKRLGIRVSSTTGKAIGAVWMAIWFLNINPFFMEGFTRSEALQEPPVKLSILWFIAKQLGYQPEKLKEMIAKLQQ